MFAKDVVSEGFIVNVAVPVLVERPITCRLMLTGVPTGKEDAGTWNVVIISLVPSVVKSS